MSEMGLHIHIMLSTSSLLWNLCSYFIFQYLIVWGGLRQLPVRDKNLLFSAYLLVSPSFAWDKLTANHPRCQINLLWIKILHGWKELCCSFLKQVLYLDSQANSRCKKDNSLKTWRINFSGKDKWYLIFFSLDVEPIKCPCCKAAIIICLHCCMLSSVFDVKYAVSHYCCSDNSGFHQLSEIANFGYFDECGQLCFTLENLVSFQLRAVCCELTNPIHRLSLFMLMNGHGDSEINVLTLDLYRHI